MIDRYIDRFYKFHTHCVHKAPRNKFVDKSICQFSFDRYLHFCKDVFCYSKLKNIKVGFFKILIIDKCFELCYYNHTSGLGNKTEVIMQQEMYSNKYVSNTKSLVTSGNGNFSHCICMVHLEITEIAIGLKFSF